MNRLRTNISILLILLFVSAGCSHTRADLRQTISLAGEWKFRIDSLDEGISKLWYNSLPADSVHLPGSMAENGKGYEVTLKTDWTGEIVDRSYFTDKKYEKYRQKGNIKIPFWLKPVKYYKGVAWYQKEVDIPAGWNGKSIILFLERPHWESTVFINGKSAGVCNSLAVPHQFDISDLVTTGRNLISIRIDNRVKIPIGINSHSITDHTQTNWNGIAGDISLRASSKIYIRDITITPDIRRKLVKVAVRISNKSGKSFKGSLEVRAENERTGTFRRKKTIEATTGNDNVLLMLDYPMGNKFRLWDEFTPDLYTLFADLKDETGKKIDCLSGEFGMREFKTTGTQFEINGQRTFLRGTVECCIFPLTGYPPTDVASWLRILGIFRDYGLNCVRFHSWCPPESAFIAGDRLGFYFQIECSSWANSGTTIGDGRTVDDFIYREGDRILEAYGNHPSFCMLTYGNEPAGEKQNEFLGKLINYWKARDKRHVYTSAAGWPAIPENDYNLTAEPRIQRWGEGLKSIINREAPQTVFDFRDIISKSTIPSVSHEIGQWCVYPDFSEISKYTGVLKATNFEIFRESLEENHMGDQAKAFLKASGKLQALCYKADVEAALRTPGFAGFHLLQLHDFPGQGTALVGVLNAFFESKGYIKPEEFRMFCNSTVPLARMTKMTYKNNEPFKATVEIAHYGKNAINDAEIICQVKNDKGEVIHREILECDKIETGRNTQAGLYQMDLSELTRPQKLTFEVLVNNTSFKNSWDFWVYPEKQEVKTGKILVTGSMDKKLDSTLAKGGSVLLLTYGKIAKDKGANVAIGFSPVFWNTAWTSNQPPHTLGLLCDSASAIFKDFPTDSHSDWQWWDPVAHSQPMILNDFPPGLRPVIQPIDTWFENRRLALAFEAKAGNGKIVVCSIDLKNIPEDRPVSKQLLASILNYINSESFDPKTYIDVKLVKNLLEKER